MQFLSEYGMFLLEILTLVAAMLLLIAGVFAIANKGKSKDKGTLEIKNLNEKYKDQKEQIEAIVLPKHTLKALKKEEKQKAKADKKAKKGKKTSTPEVKKRLFVLRFDGDIRAHAVQSLTHEVSALLSIATPKDEVLLILESPGGVVNGYGLGASQLARIKQASIPLTVAVDKVAASGGYMMASVADKIIAAPFAIIGSIGVVAQIPNFNRLLKKNNIDFEQITAGEFKRTLTMFGENTDKAREKMREDIEDIHTHFKDFVTENRPELDIQKVATGEYWLAKKALELKLIDDLKTSEDYLLSCWKDRDLFEIKFKPKKSLSDKLGESIRALVAQFRVGLA